MKPVFAAGSARAVSIAARAMYRELQSAGYERLEMIKFANAFLECVTTEGSDEQPAPITCGETGVLGPDTFAEALDFHRNRSNQGATGPFAVAELEFQIDPTVSTSERNDLLGVATAALREATRSSDLLGRTDNGTFLVALLDCNGHTAAEFCRRVFARLSEDEALRVRLQRDHLRVLSRTTRWESNDTSVDELIERLTLCPWREHSRRAENGKGRHSRPRERSAGWNLVLCGGVARGLAHIGALQTFADAGLPIRGIVGTGFGAVVGAMYCRGLKPAAILERVNSALESPLVGQMRRQFVSYLRRSRPQSAAGLPNHQSRLLSSVDASAVSSADYGELIRSVLGSDISFADLQIPFVTAATDLVEGRAVVLKHGSLLSAVRASFAIAGLFPAEMSAGRVLVDGSALSEAPVAAANALPVNAPAMVCYLQRPTQRISQFENSHQVASRLSALVHRELVREQLREQASVITLPVGDFGSFDFSRPREMVSVGRAAAAAALDRLLPNRTGKQRVHQDVPVFSA